MHDKPDLERIERCTQVVLVKEKGDLVAAWGFKEIETAVQVESTTLAGLDSRALAGVLVMTAYEVLRRTDPVACAMLNSAWHWITGSIQNESSPDDEPPF